MTIQIPVLDDRSFDQLVREALARVPVHTPEWTNLNESDPGVTILELFAFLTENLLYRGNRIPEANRLKFLSMLGIALQPPSPGVGLVTLGNDKGPLTPPLAVSVGTELKAGQVPFSTAVPMAVLPVTAAVYYKQPQSALDQATRDRYKLIYQTFLEADTDVLTFYKPVSLDPPATGKPDPVVDLADQTGGTIDRSLWVALLGPKNADPDAVRRAIAGQSLSIGVYPATQTPARSCFPSRPAPRPPTPGWSSRSRRQNPTRPVCPAPASASAPPATPGCPSPTPRRSSTGPASSRSRCRRTSSCCSGRSTPRWRAPATSRPAWTTPP